MKRQQLNHAIAESQRLSAEIRNARVTVNPKLNIERSPSRLVRLPVPPVEPVTERRESNERDVFTRGERRKLMAELEVVFGRPKTSANRAGTFHMED